MSSDKSGGEPARGYFRKVRSVYQDSVGRETVAGVHRRAREAVEPVLHGVVLDLGSGGVTEYRPGQIEFLISMDNVLEYLKHSRNEQAEDVCGDVTAIPLRAFSVDFIVTQFVLHHLTAGSYGQNARNVAAAAAEAARVMRPGGTLFIIDSMTSSFMERLQIWIYAVSRAALRLLHRPMVFFFSPGRLGRILEGHGLRVERIVHIDWGNMTEAGQTLFPRLRLPLRRLPTKCLLVAARRVESARPEARPL